MGGLRAVKPRWTYLEARRDRPRERPWTRSEVGDAQVAKSSARSRSKALASAFTHGQVASRRK